MKQISSLNEKLISLSTGSVLLAVSLLSLFNYFVSRIFVQFSYNSSVVYLMTMELPRIKQIR